MAASGASKGKRAERRIAAELGGQRTGNTGRASPDVTAGGFLVVEVKERAALPAWLKRAMGQATAAAGPGELPAAVLHETGQAYGQSLVLLRLCDFQAWLVASHETPKDP